MFLKGNNQPEAMSAWERKCYTKDIKNNKKILKQLYETEHHHI